MAFLPASPPPAHPRVAGALPITVKKPSSCGAEPAGAGAGAGASARGAAGSAPALGRVGPGLQPGEVGPGWCSHSCCGPGEKSHFLPEGNLIKPGNCSGGGNAPPTPTALSLVGGMSLLSAQESPHTCHPLSGTPEGLGLSPAYSMVGNRPGTGTIQCDLWGPGASWPQEVSRHLEDLGAGEGDPPRGSLQPLVPLLTPSSSFTGEEAVAWGCYDSWQVPGFDLEPSQDCCISYTALLGRAVQKVHRPSGGLPPLLTRGRRLSWVSRVCRIPVPTVSSPSPHRPRPPQASGTPGQDQECTEATHEGGRALFLSWAEGTWMHGDTCWTWR